MSQSKSCVAKENKIELDALEAEFQDPEIVNQLTIDHMIFMAGFLSATGFIDFVNDRIGKKGQHKIDRGQALAALMLLLYSGNYQSLNSSVSRVLGTAVPALLQVDPSICPEHLNRDVFADALESMYHYGADRIYSEFADHVISLNLTQHEISDCFHIDTTSMYKVGFATTNQAEKEERIRLMNQAEFEAMQRKDTDSYDESLDVAIEMAHWSYVHAYEPVEDDGDRPVDFTYGHSKDHRPDLPQVIVGSLVEGAAGLPMFFKIWDGNRSDKLNFADMILEFSDAATEAFKKVKYFAGDSALCTQRSFDAAKQRNLELITRVPDNLTIARSAYSSDEDLTDVCSQEEWNSLRTKESIVPKHRFIHDHELFGYPVVACLFLNENLAKTKEKSVRKNAEKEVARINKSLVKKTFLCQPDAEAEFRAIAKDLKFSTLTDFSVNAVEKNKSRGRPRKNAEPEKCIKHYTITSICKLDETKVQEAIRRECMYMLVTTDTQRSWTALDLLQMYKNNIHVESIWREMKNRKLYLSRFFLQKTERIEGLLCLLMMAVFARKHMQKMVSNLIAENKIVLSDDFPGFNKTNPRMENLDFYFKGLQAIVYSDGRVRMNSVNKMGFSIMKAMGPSWWQFLSYTLYETYKDWPSRGITEN